MNSRPLLALPVAAAVVAAGCGTGGSASSSPPPPTVSGGGAPAPSSPSTGAGALTAEAQAVAAGDIPDNQVFLTYRAPSGYSLKYPEGWARRGGGGTVTFSDKNNVVRVVVARGAAFDTASVRRDLVRLAAGTPSFHASSVRAVALPSGAAFESTYTTTSPPNPVTGKRVTLNVDRYYLSHGGRRAVVDLGGPQGVDNVDAYRLLIESFRWR